MTKLKLGPLVDDKPVKLTIELPAPFVDLGVHHQPRGLSGRIALGFTKAL